jgi:hypothetical protein
MDGTTSPNRGEWHRRLDCGHWVAVPWGAPPPCALALAMQHQRGCEADPNPVAGASWGTPGFRGTPRASYR